jgi:putative transposase
LLRSGWQSSNSLEFRFWSAPAERSGDGALDYLEMTAHKEFHGRTRLFTNCPRAVLTLLPPALTRGPTTSRAASGLQVLHRGLLSVACDFGWTLEAWSVFSNHYHFVGYSPEDGADNLGQMLGLLHEKTAKWLNRLDNQTGREVWHNFWETRLTHVRSYLARLNYVHQNPVKHRLVQVANQYPWCSASWFERTAKPAQVKTIYGFKTDRLKVLDDYEVSAEW